MGPFKSKSYLTLEHGFMFSYVASLMWGTWSFQHGVRALIDTKGRTEEDVVAIFGPHFREPSFVANEVADFLGGAPGLNQSFAASYILFDNCVTACDVLMGCLMYASIIPFCIFFGRHIWSEKGISPSTLKGRLKLWLAFILLLWIGYVGGLLGDAGNILQTLPPEAHPATFRMVGLRYIAGLFPLSNTIFGFLWYRSMHLQGLEEKGDEEVGSCLKRWNGYFSIVEWGWHIFWLLGFVFVLVLFITMVTLDMRTLMKSRPR